MKHTTAPSTATVQMRSCHLAVPRNAAGQRHNFDYLALEEAIEAQALRRALSNSIRTNQVCSEVFRPDLKRGPEDEGRSSINLLTLRVNFYVKKCVHPHFCGASTQPTCMVWIEQIERDFCLRNTAADCLDARSDGIRQGTDSTACLAQLIDDHAQMTNSEVMQQRFCS